MLSFFKWRNVFSGRHKADLAMKCAWHTECRGSLKPLRAKKMLSFLENQKEKMNLNHLATVIKYNFELFFNGGRSVLNPKSLSPPESKWLWWGEMTCPRSHAPRSWQTRVQISPYLFPEHHWTSHRFPPHKTLGISWVLECLHHLTFLKMHFWNARIMKPEMFLTKLTKNLIIALMTNP